MSVPVMMSAPKLAPFESCVACFRGDTTTGFAISGEPGFIVDTMRASTGVVVNRASVPSGQQHITIRLCRKCARLRGTRIGHLNGDSLPRYDSADRVTMAGAILGGRASERGR